MKLVKNQTNIVFFGLVANVFLAGTKFIAGILGNSYALVADSVESLVDILGSFVIFGGLRIASRDANDEFPYGLGKAEGLAAFVVGIIILFAAVGIAIEAVVEIITPHHSPEPFTLAVLLGVILTKELLHYFSKKSADYSGSIAMSADAFHHRSDSLTSAAAVIGISVAIWGGPGWAAADDWAALVASAVIFYNGISMIRSDSLHLLDRSASPEIVEKIRTAAASVEGVLMIEKLHVRASGNSLFVDIHVHADPSTKLAVAHVIGGKVKSSVIESTPHVSRVLVHMEPAIEQSSPPKSAI